MTGGKANPIALAALPVAVVLTLSALLPYFQVGDSFSEYSFTISGWSFFSTVDLLMVFSIPLAAILLVTAVVPELRNGRVSATLGGERGRSVEFPLIVAAATVVGLLAMLILFLLVLRILFPPAGLSQGAGLFIGAFLSVALAGAALGAIYLEIGPARSSGEFAPVAAATAPPPAPPATPAPPAPPPPERQAGPPPPEPSAPEPRQEPPPPAPGTRRG